MEKQYNILRIYTLNKRKTFKKFYVLLGILLFSVEAAS